MSLQKLGIGTRDPTQTLDVKGSVGISESLDISGAATLTSTLHVSKHATFNTGLYVGGDASLNGNLELSGKINGATIISDATLLNLIIGNGNIDDPAPDGSNNVGFGNDVLKSISTGDKNIAMGNDALTSVETGDNNIAIGTWSQIGNTTGSHNVSIGTQALSTITDSFGNTAIGFQALQRYTSGGTAAIGYNAGGDIIAGGWGNTFIGYGTGFDVSNEDYSGSTALGYQAKITASNQIMLGRSNETVVVPGTLDVSGDVGIGTTTPSYKLEVLGDVFFHKGDRSSTSLWLGDNDTGLKQQGDGQLAFFTNNSEKMRLTNTGRLGIGTTNPSVTLEVIGDVFFHKGNNSTTSLWLGDNDTGLKQQGDGQLAFLTNSWERMRLTNAGRLGIGTSNPNCPVQVQGSVSVGGFSRYHSEGSTGTATSTEDTSLYVNAGLGASWIAFHSDERIKKNIVDVPDNLALQQVRDIPCRYYEYIDFRAKGTDKTIGFIAQEVKEVLPMAVNKQIVTIPDEYRLLENISWEE